MRKKVFVFGIIGIFLIIQALGAQSWLSSKRLTWNSGSSIAPAVAVDSSDRIHMVWREESPGNAEIFYKWSTNGGTTWNATKRLTWNSGGSLDPVLAVSSSDNIHVIWHDGTPGNYEIFYKRSTNGGVAWESVKRLTWNSGLSNAAAITVESNDNIHVVWSDYTPGSPEIYYRRSINGGVTWGNVKRLSWNSGGSYTPAIAADSNDNIHVVWHDDTPGSSEIYYKRSTNGGVSWSGANRLTWSSGVSYNPAITADSSDNLHIVWHGFSPGSLEIYYKRSTNGGVAWGSAKRLSWTSGDSQIAEIAVDTSDNLHVVWQDKSPGDFDIYHKRSTNGGVNWSGTHRITWTFKGSYAPSIDIDSSNSIHLVWYDYTPGNYEIFYRKGIQ